MDKNNSIRISDGTLILMSKAPINIDKELGDTWVPKLSFISPSNGAVLLFQQDYLRKEGLDYFIHKNTKVREVWYNFKEHLNGVDIKNFYLIPGRFNQDKVIYTFENSFLPDKSDPDQCKRNVTLIPENSNLSYALDTPLWAHTTRENSLNIAYNFILLDTLFCVF